MPMRRPPECVLEKACCCRATTSSPWSKSLSETLEQSLRARTARWTVSSSKSHTGKQSCQTCVHRRRSWIGMVGPTVQMRKEQQIDNRWQGQTRHPDRMGDQSRALG